MNSPKTCRHCGGEMPSIVHRFVLYCSPVCSADGKKKAGQDRVRRYKQKVAEENPAKELKRNAVGAPGCGCSVCRECQLFALMKRVRAQSGGDS